LIFKLPWETDCGTLTRALIKVLSEQIVKSLKSILLIPDILEEENGLKVRLILLWLEKHQKKVYKLIKRSSTIPETVQVVRKASRACGEKVADRHDFVVPYLPPLSDEEIYDAVEQIEQVTSAELRILIVDNQRRDFLRGDWYDACNIGMDKLAEDMLKKFTPKEIDKKLLIELLVDSNLSPRRFKKECEERT